MAEPWTPEWAEAIAANDKSTVPIETLEFIHASFVENGVPTAVRACNDVVGHTFTLEGDAPVQAGQAVLFSSIPFEFGHPMIEEGRAPEASISIDNVRREMSPYFDAAELSNTPIVAIYRCYLLNRPTVVDFGPLRFVIREIEETGSTITARAGIGNPRNRKFPTRFYNAAEYPTLTERS